MAVLKDGSRAGTRANLITAGKQIGALKKDESCMEVIEAIEQHVRLRWRPLFEAHAQSVGARADDWAQVFEPPALAPGGTA
jgi:hypothetical protein